MSKGKREISVSTLRDELPQLLSRIAILGESYTIVKHGKKFAVIRPYEDGGEKATTTAAQTGTSGRRVKSGRAKAGKS
jgi:antitoxin (DNA-binding transcriptional repressor) of toxin-antitoxin stability system